MVIRLPADIQVRFENFSDRSKFQREIVYGRTLAELARKNGLRFPIISLAGFECDVSDYNAWTARHIAFFRPSILNLAKRLYETLWDLSPGVCSRIGNIASLEIKTSRDSSEEDQSGKAQVYVNLCEAYVPFLKSVEELNSLHIPYFQNIRVVMRD